MRPPARPRVPAPPVVPAAKPSPRAAGAGRALAEPPPPVEPPVEDRPPVDEPPGDLTPASRWSPRRPAVVSVGSAARFAERLAMRRRIRRDRALVWSGAAVAVAVLAWVLLWSPVLALDEAEVSVRVQGDRAVVDADAVRAVLTDQDGTPLPRLDTVGLRRQVLEVPGVRAASVSRAWPHGVLVTVVARDPVAAVPDEDGYVLLDADGVQVGRTDDAPEGLPVVDVGVGDVRSLTAVLQVLQSLPEELASQVTKVSAENQDAVRLRLADGARVEWGSADQSSLKAAVLDTLRSAEQSAGVKVYDVSAPTLPITRS